MIHPTNSDSFCCGLSGSLCSCNYCLLLVPRLHTCVLFAHSRGKPSHSHGVLYWISGSIEHFGTRGGWLLYCHDFFSLLFTHSIWQRCQLLWMFGTPLCHNSISVSDHWCWGEKNVPVHPKGVKRSGLCAGQSGSSTPNWLCSRGHYQVETGKDLLLTVATVGSTLLFEIILYSVAVQVQSQKTMTNSLRKKQKKHSTYQNKVLGLKKHRNFPLMFAIWM